MRFIPSRRFFVAWALSTSALLFTLDSQTFETQSSLPGEDDGHITLCNRKLFLKDMPRVLHDERPFGVCKWKRSLDNGVLIENRMGKGFKYGRTGNQIRTFFHAFDIARDRDGALVMHEDGFPIEIGLRSIFLGVNRTELENRFGITFVDSVEESQLSRMGIMMQKPLYHFVSDNRNCSTWDAIEHRHYVLQELYSMTAREMELHPNASGVAEICSSLHELFGDRKGDAMKKLGTANGITPNYTVIHSRSLENDGKRVLRRAHEKFGVDSSAALEYPADLISSIVDPLGMDQNSILMITDGQDKNVAARLSADSRIGPLFHTIPKEMSTLKGDLMLAILSDVFIGNPVSTFSQFIAQARYALGIGNSYLFYKRDDDGNWRTFCNDEDCLYYWINMFTSIDF